jgi:hypothetical protein
VLSAARSARRSPACASRECRSGSRRGTRRSPGYSSGGRRREAARAGPATARGRSAAPAMRGQRRTTGPILPRMSAPCVSWPRAAYQYQTMTARHPEGEPLSSRCNRRAAGLMDGAGRPGPRNGLPARSTVWWWSCAMARCGSTTWTRGCTGGCARSAARWTLARGTRRRAGTMTGTAPSGC